MRIARWNWKEANMIVVKNGRARSRKAAELLANALRRPGVCPVGTEAHPMYKKGKYKNSPWTKRDGGSLKRSVRVVEKDEKYGFEIQQISGGGFTGGARVYIGNYYAYYAQIVEFYQPFIRKTADGMKGQIKSILENG